MITSAIFSYTGRDLRSQRDSYLATGAHAYTKRLISRILNWQLCGVPAVPSVSVYSKQMHYACYANVIRKSNIAHPRFLPDCRAYSRSSLGSSQRPTSASPPDGGRGLLGAPPSSLSAPTLTEKDRDPDVLTERAKELVIKKKLTTQIYMHTHIDR